MSTFKRADWDYLVVYGRSAVLGERGGTVRTVLNLTCFPTRISVRNNYLSTSRVRSKSVEYLRRVFDRNTRCQVENNISQLKVD